jgi:hypothetical protein
VLINKVLKPLGSHTDIRATERKETQIILKLLGALPSKVTQVTDTLKEMCYLKFSRQ